MYPTVITKQQHISPSPQCKPWEKSSRGKCVCKMPFECRYVYFTNHQYDFFANSTDLINCLVLVLTEFFVFCHQFVFGDVHHFSCEWKISPSECVQNACTAVSGEEPRDIRGQHLQVAKSQHNRLHQLSHVGDLRRYGTSKVTNNP